MFFMIILAFVAFGGKKATKQTEDASSVPAEKQNFCAISDCGAIKMHISFKHDLSHAVS